MHALIIGLIVLTIALYLIGLAMSVNKEDKSFETVLGRGFRGGGFLLIAAIIIGVGIYFYNSATSPNVDLEISYVRVTEENGKKGVNIQFGGNMENLNEDKVNLVAWFYLEDKAEYSWEEENPELMDFNNSYSTTGGQVSRGTYVEPIEGKIEGLEGSLVFIPISELHMEENYGELDKKDVKFSKNYRVIVKAGAFQNNEQIGRSDEVVFIAK
jgi:hypothetical protein